MSSGRACCLGWILATLAWPPAARAQDAAGIVVDPQDRRIVGASVVLACAGGTRSAVTDAEGRFAFSPEAGAGRCVLRVTAAGFASATILARPDAGEPTTVRLAVEPVAETIEVHASATAPSSAVAGVAFTREQMRTISDDPAEILRVANARAGPSTGTVVYVDGLPAQRLPAVARMSSLAVAADPYSAEYSDPGLRRIDIVTVKPDRLWRLDLGATPGAFERPGPLGDRSRSRSLRGGVAGPAPWPGAAFSFNADIDAVEGARAVVAVAGSSVGLSVIGSRATAPGNEATADEVAGFATRRRTVSVRLQQAVTASGAVCVEVSRMADETSNAAVGGEVLPEAGFTRDGGATELRATANHDWPTVSWRSHVLANWSAYATRATSSAPGVQVQGAFIGGGAATSLSAVEQGRFFWKNVVASANGRLPWRAGVSVERSSEQSSQVPNDAGSIRFSSPDDWRAALDGAAVATVFRVADPTMQQLALLDVAVFGETAIVQQPKLRLGAGMRVDWQSRDRARLSPRLSAVAQAGAWTLGGGVGLFTQTWQPGVFLGTRVAEGAVPLVIMGRQVSLDSAASGTMPGTPIVMDVTPGLSHARYLMASQSAERRFGAVTMGVEHVWWRGTHLLGAERLATDGSSGWTDWLESNRRFDSHELRVRIAVGGPRRSASVTYGLMRSKDDTDGAWAYPARQGDLAAEWAPSARVAAHNLDAVASASLPRGVHATAVASLRGNSPYDIVSGRDAEGNGLFTDRATLPRNSGRLPGSRSVSLYLHRRFNLAALFGSGRNLPFDTGVQFDNLLAGRVWTLVGNVVGSPLFGRPEGAMPGRSVRIWFAVAQ